MINGGRNTIFLTPFVGIIGEVPLVLPFLCLRFERLIVVQVYGGGIIDGLGRDGDGDCCIGNGGRHHLSYVCDKAPEDIGSYGRIHCVFVSVALIYLRHF